jgi:hypothetical protein
MSETAAVQGGEFLCSAELLDLTGYKQADKQEEWLTEHGVPHRRDGRRVIVSRFHAREWLAGREVVSSSGPNWSALA